MYRISYFIQGNIFVTCQLYLDYCIRSWYSFLNKNIYSINPGYVLPVWFIFVKNYSLINRIIKQRTCQLRNLPRCKKFQNCCTTIKMVKRFLPLIYAICGFIHTVYHENYKLDFVSNINYLWAYNDKSSKKYQFDREIVKSNQSNVYQLLQILLWYISSHSLIS